MKFHHLGIATRNLSKIRNQYLELGYSVESEVYSDPEIGINCQFLVHPSAPRIELVEQHQDSKILESWLRSGSPMYHMAFVIENELEITLKNSITVFNRCPAVAFQGRDVSFHLGKERFLIELVHPA